MYVYCVESFAHIECYSDCSRGGAIWLNPFATVLFSVSSAVIVECCVLYPCCVGVLGNVCCYVRKKAPYFEVTGHLVPVSSLI